jgi:hypothetical protein
LGCQRYLLFDRDQVGADELAGRPSRTMAVKPIMVA